jgi:hypothetical protein
MIDNRWEMDLGENQIVLADGLDQSVMAFMLCSGEEEWLSLVEVAFGTDWTSTALSKKLDECGSYDDYDQ